MALQSRFPVTAQEHTMSTPTVEKQTTAASEDEAFDPFELDITFIENTSAAETTLLCSTGDTCGSSCPSACTTS